MFSGLQGHPAAGEHGGGYPDGEDCLFKLRLCFSVLFLIFVQDINQFFFFFFFFAFFHQVATDVIKEFAADGVKYLELRSTPREEKDTGVDVSMIA